MFPSALFFELEDAKPGVTNVTSYWKIRTDHLNATVMLSGDFGGGIWGVVASNKKDGSAYGLVRELDRAGCVDLTGYEHAEVICLQAPTDPAKCPKVSARVQPFSI